MGLILAVVALVLIAPALMATAFLQIYGVGLLAVLTAVVSGIAVTIATILKMRPAHAARVAAGLSLVPLVALGVVLAFVVNASADSCDSFCFSQNGARLFVLILFPSYGVLLALTSSFVTWIIVTNIRGRGRTQAVANGS